MAQLGRWGRSRIRTPAPVDDGAEGRPQGGETRERLSMMGDGARARGLEGGGRGGPWEGGRV
jgi:hypothetical protein